MDIDRYQQAKSLFIAAAEMPVSERDAFVAKACLGQPELLQEVRSLLAHHDSRTLLPVEKPTRTRHEPTAFGRWTVRLLQPWSRSLRSWTGMHWLTAFGVTGLLVGIGGASWIYWTLREAERFRQLVQLQSQCRETTSAIVQVIERDLWIAQACGTHPEIGRAVELCDELRDQGDGLSPLLQLTEQRRVLQQILEAFWGSGVQFQVWNRSHQRVAASIDAAGPIAELTADRWNPLRAAVIDGGSIVRLPASSHVEPRSSSADAPLPGTEFLVPVRGRQREIIGVLLLRGTGSDRRLQRALEQQRFGVSGAAYLFDRTGRVLTRPQRKDGDVSGLQAPPSDAPDRLEALWRPTADSVDSAVVAWRAGALSPQQLLLQRAATGPPGASLDGYTTNAEVRQAAAWQWLDAYDFGAAVEIDRSELLRSLRSLDVGFAIGLGLMLVGFVGFQVLVMWIQRRLQARERQRLGPYVLDELLGEGGMGQVYKAHHDLLKRPTAVKVLKPEVVSEASLRRFTREVQFASRLQHPNTVDIYDYGQTHDGRFYYAMECLAGVSLAELVKRFGPLPPARATYLLQQICGSLREAHQMGLVHRDVKPQNIMVCVCGGEADVVKVLDFGLVKEIDSAGVEGETTVAEWVGTPRYMAPERVLQPSGADPRSDIYSCGAVAYWLLTGREVFDNSNLDTLLNDIVLRAPETMACLADLPERLRDLIVRCLAKDPLERPQSMVDFQEALTKRQPEPRWTAADAAAWWRLHLPDYWEGVPQPPAARRSFVA